MGPTPPTSNAAVRVIQGPLPVPLRILPIALVFEGGSVPEVRSPMTMTEALLPFPFVVKGVVRTVPPSLAVCMAVSIVEKIALVAATGRLAINGSTKVCGVKLGSTKICGVNRRRQPVRGHRLGRKYENEARIHSLHDQKTTLPPMCASALTPRILVLPSRASGCLRTATTSPLANHSRKADTQALGGTARARSVGTLTAPR